MSSLSLTLPQLLSCREGNSLSSLKRVTPLEEKVTMRSFQGFTCKLSSSNHSNFGKASSVEQLRAVEAQATEPEKKQIPKPAWGGSIVCKQCEGNGAIECTQCKGKGTNQQDFFNGLYKAGSICWLCRGKRDILCGECNGAGFMGGFVSSLDD